MQSTDQLGNIIELDGPALRIISLVPSQTELLFDLGLDKEIVGVTRFCIHPKDKTIHKEKIGGTKRFDIERIKTLEPDLIIGNKEENYVEGITELQKYFPVWMSDIYTLKDSFVMMRELGRVTGKENAAEQLVQEISSGFNEYAANHRPTQLKVAYFIWRKPYMVAGANTFINHMLEIFGVENVFKEQLRYPEIDPAVLRELQPDLILLSSEPYSFSEKHFEEFSALAPQAKVILVDGEMFSWYGSRLKLAPAYFSRLQQQLIPIQ